MRIDASSRLEPLVDALAQRLRDDPLPDPMQLERVAVPSRGSERWLSQQLAERLGRSEANNEPGEPPDGVCAGIDFPFPGALVEEVVAAATGDDGNAAWTADRLMWPVLEILDGFDADDHAGELEPLRAHLQGFDGLEAARRTPLARRVADTFDRYNLLRPRMVRAWEDGVDAHPELDAVGDADTAVRSLQAKDRWQPHLWRWLRSLLGAESSAARLHRAVQTLERAAAEAAGTDTELAAWLRSRLPPRVSVFGVTALPPAHLRLLAALGEVVDVTVYLLAPSPRLWTVDAGTVPEPRHPLLSSLGAVGAGMAWATTQSGIPPDHIRWLDPDPGQPPADPGQPLADPGQPPADPNPTSLLARLQHDITADRRPEEAAAAAADGTVQVHGCHGPSRQVEVLREIVTGLLADEDAELEPRDVLVMTPDLDTFAPLITAVFDDDPAHTADEGAGRRPALRARIADRRLDSHNEVAAVLLRLLDLVDSRVTASQVLDLLTAASVQRRFGLESRDVDTLTGWVRDTGIHWGIDAAHRAAHGQPAEPEHTWQAGLDRLRVGVAVADEDDRCVADVVPYDHVEGDDVDRLGRLSRALQTLFAHVRALETPRPIHEWHAAALAAVDDLTALDRDERWQRRQVHAVLDGLVDAAEVTGEPNTVALTLSEIRGELRAKLGRQPAAAAYATGDITVCELAPLRAVPHKVVCLLGLDDGVFPRNPTAMGFDLVADDPHPADREARAEDRQLLLDAVLAARGHLVVTYTSREPRTNETQPPSAPLGELIEAIARTCGRAGDDHDAVVTHHPLQPFHPGYFTVDAAGQRESAHDGEEPRLPHSFDAEQLEAARAHREQPKTPRRFVERELPEPASEELDPTRVDLAALEEFYRNPLRRLLRHRLGVATSLREGGVEDRDRWELDHLQLWQVRDEQLRRWCADADLDAWRVTARRRGELPPGTPGAFVLDQADDEVDALCETVAAKLGDAGPPAWEDTPVSVALDVAGQPVTLAGVVGDRVDDRLVLLHAASLGARRQLTAWLRLLAVAAHDSEVVEALIVGREKREQPQALELTLAERDDPQAYARDRLAELIALFWQGHRRALALMPKTAAQFVYHEGAPHTSVPKAAREAWEGNDWMSGEDTDEAVRLALGPEVEVDELFDDELAEAAATVWQPLFDHGGEL